MKGFSQRHGMNIAGFHDNAIAVLSRTLHLGLMYWMGAPSGFDALRVTMQAGEIALRLRREKSTKRKAERLTISSNLIGLQQLLAKADRGGEAVEQERAGRAVSSSPGRAGFVRTAAFGRNKVPMPSFEISQSFSDDHVRACGVMVSFPHGAFPTTTS